MDYSKVAASYGGKQTTEQQVDYFAAMANQFGGTVIENAPLRPLTEPMPKPTPEMSFRRGIRDFTTGIAQGYKNLTGAPDADAYTSQQTADQERYEQSRGADAGTDWWRLGGNALATVPTMAIAPEAMGARVVAGALEGAGTAGLMFTPEGESTAQRMAIGGGLGAAAAPVTKVAGDAIGEAWSGVSGWAGKQGRRIANVLTPEQTAARINQDFAAAGINLAGLPAAVRDATRKRAEEMLSATGMLDPKAAYRKAVMDDLGFVGESAPMPGQVTRDPVQWRETDLLSQQTEVGGPILAREQAQRDRLIAAGNKMATDMGGTTGNMIEAEQKALQALRDRWETTGADVSAKYKAAADADGADALFPTDQMAPAFQQVLDEAKYLNPPAALVRDMEDIISGEMQPTVKEMVNLRKAATALSNSSDGNLRYVGRQVTEAIDSQGFDSNIPAVAAYNEARAAARQRFQEFGVGAKEKSKLEPIAAGKAVSDQWVVKNIMSNPSHKDVMKIKTSMDNADPQLWSDVKTEITRELMGRATKQGEGKFSHAQFRASMGELRKGGKLAAIYSPAEVDQLEKLLKVSEWLTTAPAGAVKGSPTAPMLLNVLNNLDRVPALGTLGAAILRPAIAKVKADAAQKRVSNLLTLSDKKAYNDYIKVVEKADRIDWGKYPATAATGRALRNYLQALPSAMAAPTLEEVKR